MIEFETFCFLQNHKTGCTLVEVFLRRHCGEDIVRYEKHWAPSARRPGKFYFVGVREPLDAYLSLFNFGLDGHGEVFEYLHEAGQGQLYAAGIDGFGPWLRWLLDADRAAALYPPDCTALAPFCGLLTSRFLRLAIPGCQLPFRDPTWAYLILSPQRAGSDYLCRRLCNVRGRFGMPGEYLDPAAARMLASRLLPGTPLESIPFASYMRAVQRARTSADGCFGIKAHPAQLAAFAPGDRALFDFAASFHRIVVLTRRDKLGQAIAGTIPQLTGTWSKDGTQPAMDDARLPQLLPAIAANLARCIDEDRRIAALGKALDRPWLRMVYEDILSDGQGAFACLADFLAGGEPIELDQAADVPVPEKPPGDFTEELRARFLRYIGGGNAA